MKFTHNNNEYELIILHLAGSRLYGNSTPQSDHDIRGVFIASKETKLGILGSVEQIEGIQVWESLQKAGLDLVKTDDICLYELNRFTSLVVQNNPNVMDTLCFDYTKPEITMYINDKGKELIDNKKLFLSSKLKFTFSGYAISQLSKIRNRDKYLTKYPDVSKVLEYIKYFYARSIDFNWVCDNFGGAVAEFVSGETSQNCTKLDKDKLISWEEFDKGNHNNFNLNNYRVPRLFDYCHAKDLKGKQLPINSWAIPNNTNTAFEGLTIEKLLNTRSSFRTFSPSMLAIYTDGNGIFTKEGKLKANDPETIGDFVCLLSIDQMNYKSDKDFNSAMWEWKCKRNETRSAMEAEYGIDLKNLSHLWRLMTKAKEILLTGNYEPTLYGDDLATLKGIRDGSLYGDKSYDFALKFAEENDEELDELYKTTMLPKKPNIKEINKLILRLHDL